jgi:hypothetical protein
MNTMRTPPPPPGLMSYSFEGIWETNDPAHPAGGSITYMDENNVKQVKTKMWTGTCFTFIASSAPYNKIGVGPCM